MPTIELKTKISAPIERCFLLSLSVDLHQLSTKETNERAIAGVTKGLMKLNDVVTWRAKHFGIYQNMTSKVSEYDYPKYFVSEMVKGAFKKLHHQHKFEWTGNETIMTDIFYFEAPFGISGELFSKFILTNYMKSFLIKRNNTIKEIAESSKWKSLLDDTEHL
ncbi:MAG: SRPBCC family protein [Bacteroidota bacterium]